MNNQFIKSNPISSAFIAAVVALPLVFAAYFSFEPIVVVGEGSVDEEFTITQEVSSEISFEVPPIDITMDTTITGLTGGTSDGSTTFRVATNNSSGYNVTLEFETNTDGQVLVFNDDNDIAFSNIDATPVFDLLEPSSSGEEALFGYSVFGENVANGLGTDGGSCGGTTGTESACFSMHPSPSSAFVIIDTSTSTRPTGEENGLAFRAVSGPDPDPTLPSGTYTATATLTALTN